MGRNIRRFFAVALAFALLFSGNVVAKAQPEPASQATIQTKTVSQADAQAVLAQRRDIAEAHMRSMCSMLWRCEEDILYTTYNDQLPETATESHHLVKGRVYQGLPYSYSGGSKASFLDLATGVEETGVVNISGLNWRMLSGSGAYSRFGNDCSGAVCQAWAQIGTSADIKQTAKMTLESGYLRVGEYTSSDTTNSKTDKVCINNGEQTMYAAYAQTQKADALVYYKTNATTGTSYGHVIMVVNTNVVYNEDGTINGDESTVTILEQTRGWIRQDTHVYNEELGEDVYWICGVDIEYTFVKLFESGYLPITCKELVDPATVEAPQITDTLSADSYSLENLFTGTISTNHWMIDRVQVTITDSNGEIAQQCSVCAPRTSRYSFQMSLFKTEVPTKRLGYIALDALEKGDYHCKVAMRLSTGQEYTVRDYDFTVGSTKNDIYKTKLDFTSGTIHDCPACGEKEVQWNALTTANVGKGNGPAVGHYYLVESMTANEAWIPFSGGEFCLYLNGKEIKSSERAIYVNNDATLNILGEGTITGGYTSKTTYCGVAIDNYGGTVNLYGGTYKHYKVTDKDAKPIIGIRVNGKVNLYDGAHIQGTAGVVRSSVLIHQGYFTMYGGKITDGYAANGGNILVGYSGSDEYYAFLQVYGGEISGGSATELGGNIYSVYDSFTYIRESAVVKDGSAAKGGNICMNKGANLRIDGGAITGGTAKTIGNNLYMTNTANSITGTKLSDCGAMISGTAELTGVVEADNNAFVTLRSGAELMKDSKIVACYGAVETALSQYAQGGYDYLKLYQNTDLSEGDWKADLNGNTVFLSEGATLEVTTDGQNLYPVQLGISKINLRASVAGIYYTGTWNAGGLDMANYGIATSVADMPGTDFFTDADTLYTVSAENGALIKNIFSKGAEGNNARGETSIHGAAYVTFADGSTIIGGRTASYSLYDLVTYLESAENSKWEAQREEFITTWADVFSAWGIGT